MPATRGLSSAECVRLVPSYDLPSGLVEPETADAAVQERFEMSRSAARRSIAEAIQRLAENRVKGTAAPGSRFRNFHTAIHLRGFATQRLAFPAYAIAYRIGAASTVQ